MEKTKKALALQRTAFTRICDRLEDEMSKERYHIVEIQSNIRVLDDIMHQINELNQLMLDLMLDSEDAETTMNSEVELMYKLSSQYHKIKFNFEKINKQDTNSQKSESKSKLKFPKIEFRQFGGDIKSWLSFWNQFSRIDEDSDIEEEDKLQYLVQATAPASRARQIVESYPATKGNYAKAIDSLKKRFGRKDLLIEVYVRDLLKLVITNLNSKNKLSTFFDKIESQLRALESLDIKSDDCAAMLYPLVESCIGEDLIRAWHRSQFYSEESNLKKRLDTLMDFLRKEVLNEDRISLAVSSFKDRRKPEDKSAISNSVPTASELFNKGTPRCVFCKGSHSSDQCKEAFKLSFTERKQKLTEAACCHSCTRFGHISRRCRLRENCFNCHGKHCKVMCPKEDVKSSNSNDKIAKEQGSKINEQNLSNHTYPEVFLQTMVVELKGEKESRRVRLLIDTGSHKSYITKKLAEEVGYIPIREQQLVHSLFGGSQTETVNHVCYKARLYSLTENYCCNFEVLDQPLICNYVSSVTKGPWLDQLKEMGIEMTDTIDGPIDVLIGADVAGKLFSGRKHDLECGLVAVHTLLGWTLMGKLKPAYKTKTSLLVTSLFSKDVDLPALWNLDVLGIQDPVKNKSQKEQEALIMEHFLSTVKQREDKRYEVNMPWLEGHSPLPTNFDLSHKRLLNMTKKLKKDNFYNVYDEVFDNWLAEEIIEPLPDNNESFQMLCQSGHFLSHHPVYKPSSATSPVRPVFDASSKEKNQPSLNQCLEKGINLIELIPSMILRFRTEKIGVTADIKKAFLQISLQERDRHFLKFLWYDKDENLKIFRHTRVVFGVSCSPFLLGAVLDHHLKETFKKSECEQVQYSPDVISKLMKSFYVDNVLTSVPDKDALKQFIEQSTSILADGKFELRGWEYSLSENVQIEAKSNILGLVWNRNLDTLELSLEFFDKLDTKHITKRNILSTAHKLFDPIGFSCPVSLIPKMLLQKTWSTNLGWDVQVTTEIREIFLKWLQDLPYLIYVKVPRWIASDFKVPTTQSLHVFCDASADAYAACLFLRTEADDGQVLLRLIEAKSRVAPLKKLTIPRLELLAATIGVRLFQNFQINYEMKFEVFFWSDSTTVLSWIKKDDNWKPFIWNRVEEIKRFTKQENWYHVPGYLNPADLPSRGCSAKTLANGRWWEGPRWLLDPVSEWPSQNFECDEEEVNKEKRKTVVSSLNVAKDFLWYYQYFSKFSKIVNMIAWIIRFINNCKKRNYKIDKFLSPKEIEMSTKMVIRFIQEESFQTENDPKLSSLCPFTDEEGLIRVHTKISDRVDRENFRMPYVLPSNHEVVKRLILEEHNKNNHVGVQGLMSILRENYWILQCRRTVKSVINRCTTCKRFRGKMLETPAICLPENRVRDAAVFEIVGIDLTGPLYLKSNQKVWIVLYTCAIYRAVHLELTSSLSSNAFLQKLRRFIARRGRPSTIYTDSGANFVGCVNALEKIDWSEVVKNCSTIQKIEWKMNPPTAAWWGGWWERLIRLMKDLLRKTLGKTSLDMEELQTVLCDCEAVLNARPLTYMSEDPNDYVVLTPSMFLQDLREVGVLDIDLVEGNNLSKRFKYRLKLREDINKRFKSEYLGQLTLFSKKNCKEAVKVGDIVLISDFNKKKFDWPMGRVIETIPGRDGVVRIVRLKTAAGELLRPVQRILLMEMESLKNLLKLTTFEAENTKNKSSTSPPRDPDEQITRSGRHVKVPARYRI